MPASIIAVAEIHENKIASITYEVAAAAQLLSLQQGLPLLVCVIGSDIEKQAGELAAETGHDVIGFSFPAEGYRHDVYCEVLAAHLPALEPAFICIPHTAQGLDFAPALAARIKGTCITGVEDIRREGEKCLLRRRIHNGRQMAAIEVKQAPAVVTIPAGTFKQEKHPGIREDRPPTVRIERLSVKTERIRNSGVRKEHGAAGGLKTADVIVAAGNGIGKEENIDLIYKLAGSFPKSAVAGSRPVCDRRILPYNRQVGITGAVVNPKLYIACGVSGSSQHIAGMRESGFIVSVNTDPKAAIRNYADICVVEDLKTFIPIFIERLKGC